MTTKNDWPAVPLKEVCESIVDCVNKTAPSGDQVTPYKMIRTTNVRDGWVNLTKVKYVEKDVFEKWNRRIVPRIGDVILTREAPLGEVGMLRENDQVFLGQRLMLYRANPDKLDRNYLLFAFQERFLQGQIKSQGSGATVEHLRVPDAENLAIKLPPLKVQHQMGSILAAYNDLIENNARRIKILEEMAQTIYREWFVKFRFPGHEKVKMIDSPLGPIPEGWEIIRLGDIAEEIRRGIPKGNLEEPMPYVGLEHIPRKSLALNNWDIVEELGSNKLIFEQGEVLFGKIRPYFHKVSVAPFRGICSADTIVIRSISEEYTALVTACVSSENFVAHATATSNGAKMPRANWKVLVEYQVLKPAPDLLGKFSIVFNTVVEEQQNLVLRNNVLRKTREFLLPRLITGEIDILEMEKDSQKKYKCVNG